MVIATKFSNKYHNRIAPISRTHQPPIMNPYFKPSRYKKHVNEPQELTQHTKVYKAITHQLHPTQPSSQLDVSALPQHAQPIILFIIYFVYLFYSYNIYIAHYSQINMLQSN